MRREALLVASRGDAERSCSKTMSPARRALYGGGFTSRRARGSSCARAEMYFRGSSSVARGKGDGAASIPFGRGRGNGEAASPILFGRGNDVASSPVPVGRGNGAAAATSSGSGQEFFSTKASSWPLLQSSRVLALPTKKKHASPQPPFFPFPKPGSEMDHVSSMEERIVAERIRRKLEEVNATAQKHLAGVQDHVNFTMQQAYFKCAYECFDR